MPIEELAATFMDALEPGVRLVVSAPTGSGKSTQLPLWLREGLRGPVLVVEPRRVAARALAEFVAKLDGSPVGARVGYRVRFDVQQSAQTEILFVTPGMALAMLGDRDAPDFAAVLIDEFHERSWEIDLLTALAHRGRFGSDCALVVCSATLEVEALQKTLAARHLEGRGRSFEVDVHHEGEGGPTLDGLDARVSRAVRRALRTEGGDLLVFLPGKREISACASALHGIEAQCVPLHGGLPPGAMTRALSSSSQRRVFLATNVAETSLTIPSVTVVIDGGLVRRRIHRRGHSVLAVVPISHASAEQRRGRAGRVQAGECVRLWSSAFALEPATPPEVSRVELDDLLLRCGMCGVAPARVAELPWIDAPPAFALQSALERLTERGVVGTDGELTDVGRAQARLPVSWVGARLLANAPASLRATLCDLVAVLELRRDLLHPSPTADQEHARAELFEGARDEVDVALRCLRDGDAIAHGLQRKSLSEARRLAASLRKTTRSRDGELAPREALVEHVIGRVEELVFVRRPRADRGGRESRNNHGAEPWGNGEQELNVRPYRVPSLEQQPKPPRAAVVLDREWLGQGQRARGVGRMLLSCALEDIAAAGLGEATIETPKIVRGRVEAQVRTSYAGVSIADRVERLRGTALLDALVVFILRGRRLKGVAAPLLDALHTWGVLAQVGARQRTPMPLPPSDSSAFIRGRLEALGVAELGDLELLTADDLVPDVLAMAVSAGIDPREADALARELPRRLEVPGGLYACSVDVATRTVELSPLEGTKKEPPAHLLPRLRGFAVVFVKASRRLRLR